MVRPYLAPLLARITMPPKKLIRAVIEKMIIAITGPLAYLLSDRKMAVDIFYSTVS